MMLSAIMQCMLCCPIYYAMQCIYSLVDLFTPVTMASLTGGLAI